MTYQAPPQPALAGADPGRQVAQLREVLMLVEAIGARAGAADADDRRLDEAALVSAAYDAALPVAQRRFDALAAETAVWAAAGVEALLAAGEDCPPRSAAARLADELERAIAALGKLIA